MKTENFRILINALTGREFKIKTNDAEIIPDKTYHIYITTPILKLKSGFDFKTPKNQERLIKSFVTTFCNKYKEPNPRAYDWSARTYGEKALYENKTPEEKERCFYHHSSNMYNKKQLLEQIKENLSKESIENVLCKYGFYHTLYGLGIFVLFSGKYEINAIQKMADYLKENNIPFRNEFSDQKWVYRFVLNIDKEIHKSILENFNSTY